MTFKRDMPVFQQFCHPCLMCVYWNIQVYVSRDCMIPSHFHDFSLTSLGTRSTPNLWHSHPAHKILSVGIWFHRRVGECYRRFIYAGISEGILSLTFISASMRFNKMVITFASNVRGLMCNFSTLGERKLLDENRMLLQIDEYAIRTTGRFLTTSLLHLRGPTDPLRNILHFAIRN